MPVSAIIYQPAVGQLLAAYRPIVFKVEAIATGGDPVPPYVVADIYIQDVYYKSIIRTSAEVVSTMLSQWNFDISDALQEYLQPDIAVITNSDILPAVHMSAKVMVRFRSSDYDEEGFTVEEGTRPIQATRNTPAAAGSGLQSNSIFVINAALQHEDNQNLEVHLNSYKTGSWSANAFPLSHRSRYLFCPGDSDHFPIVFTGDCIDADMTINYRLRGQTGWSSQNSSGGGAGCDAIGIDRVEITGNQVSVFMDVEAVPSGQYVIAEYRKQGDTVWIWTGVNYGGNFSFNINGADIAGDYEIRLITFCSACSNAVSEIEEFTLSGEVENSEWRGINPYCVVQNPEVPIYMVLEARNLVTTDTYYPSDEYRTSRVQAAYVDLYAKFYSDAAHLTPVSVTETDMAIYVKQKNTMNTSSSAGSSDQVVEVVQSFVVDPAGVEVELGQVMQQNIVQTYEVPWDGTGFPAVAATSTSNYTYSMFPDHQLTSGNTGYRAFNDLQEYNADTNTPIMPVSTKPNDSGDPDYIPPYLDPATCPAGPPQTKVAYGYKLEIAKVELIFNGSSTYAQTITNTGSGGYEYSYPVPRNTNVTVTVKAKTLDAGNTSGTVKVRVQYVDGAGITQSETFTIPSNVETTLPQIFQNIQVINISNY